MINSDESLKYGLLLLMYKLLIDQVKSIAI